MARNVLPPGAEQCLSCGERHFLERMFEYDGVMSGSSLAAAHHLGSVALWSGSVGRSTGSVKRIT